MHLPLAVRRIALCAFCLPLGCGPSPDEGSYQSVMEGATSRIQQVGGKPERKSYSAMGRSVDGWSVDLSNATIGPETFEALKSLDRVCTLYLRNTNFSDEHIKQLADPTLGGCLVEVDLSGTKVTDAGLLDLSESVYLMKLNVSRTAVTDEGVKEWQKQRSADSRILGPFKKVEVTH
jgi:hypothetical protein